MKQFFLSSLICLGLFSAKGQIDTYKDSLETFQLEYMMNHEVVKGDDRKLIDFYDVKSQFRIVADFEPIKDDSTGIIMKTSGPLNKKFYRYGLAHFRIKNKPFHLTIYRADPATSKPEYEDYLFLPFTDKTCGDGSYGGGRYIDLSTADVVNNKIVIDFNKAYNPYCAYATGYNCPIPPKENYLDAEIKAGEKDYKKKKDKEKDKDKDKNRHKD